MEERILAQHPDPNKHGVRISRAKYDVVRAAIRDSLRDAGPLGFEGLSRAVETKLAGGFDGSVSWYVTTVKLDLEARGEVERLPGSGPQLIRLREA